MRRSLALICLLVPVLGLFLASYNSPYSDVTAAESSAAEKSKFVIVPLVTLKPGETKELLLSTWCTVGVTRGGGFNLAEMRDGAPVFNHSPLSGNKKFEKNGVKISVPEFSEATGFAASKEFAPLKKYNIDAFKVTITAAEDAEPGLLEMHLLDATCAGHCKTDFRVVVVAP